MAKHSEDQPKSTLVKTRKRRDPKRDVEFPRAILFWNAVVACYENKLQEAFIPKKGVVDVWTWSRIRNGTVHPGGSAKKLLEFLSTPAGMYRAVAYAAPGPYIHHPFFGDKRLLELILIAGHHCVPEQDRPRKFNVTLRIPPLPCLDQRGLGLIFGMFRHWFDRVKTILCDDGRKRQALWRLARVTP